jgi:hypothetical protein
MGLTLLLQCVSQGAGQARFARLAADGGFCGHPASLNQNLQAVLESAT